MFTRSIIRLTLALIIVVSAVLLVTSFTANAAATAAIARPRADLIVNPGESIQAAIDAANDGDTILINAGDYTESLTLSKPVSLTGVNSDTTILHAVAGQRVLTVTGATISNSVVISGLTFTGGDISSYSGYRAAFGGGILIIDDAQPRLSFLNIIHNHALWGGGVFVYHSPLVLSHASLIDNVATMFGGGISMSGAAHITSSRIEGNQALGNDGGGLDILGPAILTDVIVTGNFAYGEGGGLQVSGPTQITSGVFEMNHSTYSGGIVAGDALTITHTQIISNRADWSGGGIWVIGPFTSQDSSFMHNIAGGYGGGVMSDGSVSLTRSIFIDNRCLYALCGGGGLLIESGDENQVSIENSLFTNNQAQYQGAAIYLDGPCLRCTPSQLYITHTTIASPTLVGISSVFVEAGRASLNDTIIANHTIGISNTGGTVTEDYNLFYGNVTNTVGVITGAHSLVGDPHFVDPAHDNYHLAFGSAAIDHGVDAGVYTDLDGHPRPIGPGFDIGAYEYQGPIYRAFLPILRR